MDNTGRLDEQELRRFIGQRYPGVVAAVALVTGSRPAAEDAVQEALVRAWERSERGEVIEHLAAWVTTVALNLARSGLRRIVAEQKARLRLGPPASPAVPDVDGVAVRQALEKLPRRQREVTVLRYYAGLDVAGIACALEISEGTVKTCLHRAREALVALFEPSERTATTTEGLAHA
jgi:RNA polymerase sigma-70 factor, ECF subfamily